MKEQRTSTPSRVDVRCSLFFPSSYPVSLPILRWRHVDDFPKLSRKIALRFEAKAVADTPDRVAAAAQAKIDCACSDSSVKLIGISGGVSYGALGMSRHSAQDTAALSAIPSMCVCLPTDRHQTRKLIQALLADQKFARVRVGRNPAEDLYSAGDCPFAMNEAAVLGNTENPDLAIVACGEMVRPAIEAARALEAEGIRAAVVDMYCVKPLDKEAILALAPKVKGFVTVEEHAPLRRPGLRGNGSSVPITPVCHCAASPQGP